MSVAVNVKTEKQGFYPIYTFMERELGLKGNTLRVYALVFAYTSGEHGLYFGTRKYLAESLGISLRTLYRAIARLVDLGLIEHTVTDQGRFGIRCSFVHENDRREEKNKPAGPGGFVFTEEQKTRALDNLVRKTYGELKEPAHLAARAAIRADLEKKARERELNETVDRIMKTLKWDQPRKTR